MQKVINSLATITYCKEYDGIEILFSKTGDLVQYEDTMDLALNMAELNQCDKWMIIKKSFEDISIDEFLLFISNWIINGGRKNKAGDIKTKCKIAIVTQKQIRSKIKSKFNYFKNNNYSTRQIDLKIFDAEKEAIQFLNQSFLPLLFSLDKSKQKKEKASKTGEIVNDKVENARK